MPVDPDAPPPGFHSPTKITTPAQRAAAAESRKKAYANGDWMLQGYAAQLAKGSEQNGSDADSENSRRAALIQASDASLNSEEQMNRLMDVHYDRQPPKPAEQDPSPPRSTPLANSSAAVLKPFLAAEPSRAPQPFAAPSPVFQPLTGPLNLESGDEAPDGPTLKLSTRTRSGTEDPAAMDIPGMTALENNPATREENDLADADLLPGERRTEERPHHALQLELPIARSSDRIDKLQNDALRVPGSPTQLKKPAVAAKPPTLLPPIDDSSEMVPHPSPLRNHVDDPFDILH